MANAPRPPASGTWMTGSLLRVDVAELAPYVPGDQPHGSGWVKLNTNEHPDVLPGINDAVRRVIDGQLRLYPDPTCSELRERLSERYGIRPEQIIVGNGSDELLALALRACVDPGDRVVTPYPTYSVYRTLAEIHGAHFLEIDSNERFALPIGELVRGSGRVTFIAHPNAPTGKPVSHDDMAALCEGVSGVVVADEAYVDFGAASTLPLLSRYPNLLITRTMSKGFGLAGLRIGYAFGSEDLVGGLYKVKDSYNVNRLSQWAGIAALAKYDLAMAANRRLARRRDELADTLRTAFGWSVWPSRTNFLLAEPQARPAVKVYEALRERRVLVRHFAQRRLEPYVRISVGSESDHIALVGALRELLV